MDNNNTGGLFLVTAITVNQQVDGKESGVVMMEEEVNRDDAGSDSDESILLETNS